MKVLIACEFSGKVREAFRAKGHDALSCDLLPSEREGPHYVGDVFDLDLSSFDMMVAHPPCTYLANSGVCHLHRDAKRWLKLFDAAAFFEKLLKAPIPRIAVENPIMHKYARKLIGGFKPSQIVQPWMFGHAEQKATGLWLRALPPLVETDNVQAIMKRLPANERQRLHYLPPSPERWKLRSETFGGIALAMADQWGDEAKRDSQP